MAFIMWFGAVLAGITESGLQTKVILTIFVDITTIFMEEIGLDTMGADVEVHPCIAVNDKVIGELAVVAVTEEEAMAVGTAVVMVEVMEEEESSCWLKNLA